MQFFTNRKKGFTLIELLVVIAIIGTLATIVLVSLNKARSKARDTRRVSDLRQMAMGLEMYYDAIGSYPAATSSLSPDYMASVPTDPKTSAAYGYNYCTDGSKYVLQATLENTGTLLDNDVDGTQCTLDCVDASMHYCIMP